MLLEGRPTFCLNRMAITLCIYLCYLGALTLAPFDFSIDPFARRMLVAGSRSLADVVFNILGFVPLGGILYCLTRPIVENRRSPWGFIIGAVAAVSLAIETGQIFLPARFPSLSDLLANTLGGGLGFWLAHHFPQWPWTTHLIRHHRKLVLFSLTVYLGGLTSLLLWGAPPQTLDSWDPHYQFLIANEATLNRPWLGRIFFVGLYDRALTIAEVRSHFQAGPYVEPAVHLQGMPIALYTFQEGRGIHIYDRSPVGPPLHLEIAEPRKVIWLPNGGLELTGPTRLHSTQWPEKIYQRLTATHSFSVTAWVEPKDAQQSGPARLVSFSLNPWSRNFSLLQEASEIHFRVRTQMTGPNGTEWDLRTRGLELGPQLTHLAAIYARGTKELYVNGIRSPGSVTWDGLTVIARILAFDASSRWQRGLLVLLLLGPVGGALWSLHRR